MIKPRPQWRVKPRTSHDEPRYYRTEVGAFDAAWRMAHRREWLGGGMNRVYIQHRQNPMSKDWVTVRVIHGYGPDRKSTEAADWNERAARDEEKRLR